MASWKGGACRAEPFQGWWFRGLAFGTFEGGEFSPRANPRAGTFEGGEFSPHANQVIHVAGELKELYWGHGER